MRLDTRSLLRTWNCRPGPPEPFAWLRAWQLHTNRLRADERSLRSMPPDCTNLRPRRATHPQASRTEVDQFFACLEMRTYGAPLKRERQHRVDPSTGYLPGGMQIAHVERGCRDRADDRTPR